MAVPSEPEDMIEGRELTKVASVSVQGETALLSVDELHKLCPNILPADFLKKTLRDSTQQTAGILDSAGFEAHKMNNN
jgi:hypothetical protein